MFYNEEGEKAGLSVNTISLDTMRSRVKECNLTGFNKNQQPPIIEIKPIVCEFCIYLGKMGFPQIKTTVIELVNDFLSGTELECKSLIVKSSTSSNAIKKWAT